MKSPITIGLVTGCAALAVLAILYIADPASTTWSPKCLMLMLTGYKCPGCGIQRMVHHLLHGDIIGAVRYNYFAAIALPILLLMWTGAAFPHTRIGTAINRRIACKEAAYTYIVLYAIWWIVRNILDL